MRNRKKSHRLFFIKRRGIEMYLSEMNMEQGSALGEITEIKRERKLLDSGFLTNILSNVSQNTGGEYMQGAQRIDARYLGVVVWR